MKELINIQEKLKAPKGQYNSFGKYKYRSCEDILEAVKPILKEENTFLTITDELVNIGDRYYIKATAKLSNGTDSIEVNGYAREEETKKGMDGSQITGASSSYARKYALNGLFLIDDTKDSDSTNEHSTNNSGKRDLAEIITEMKKATNLETATKLKDEAKELGLSEKQEAWLKREYETIYNNLK